MGSFFLSMREQRTMKMGKWRTLLLGCCCLWTREWFGKPCNSVGKQGCIELHFFHWFYWWFRGEKEVNIKSNCNHRTLITKFRTLDMCAPVYAWCAQFLTWIFIKILLVVIYYHEILPSSASAQPQLNFNLVGS